MKNLITIALIFTTLTLDAATSGSLILRGVVPSLLSIVITPESIANVLPLDISQTNTKVAEIREKSNSNTGYKVTISSANLGNLKRFGGTQLFPYVLKYNNVTLNLAAPTVNIHSSPSNVNTTKDVTITYTGIPAESMLAGDYTDSILFTIAAN